MPISSPHTCFTCICLHIKDGDFAKAGSQNNGTGGNEGEERLLDGAASSSAAVNSTEDAEAVDNLRVPDERMTNSLKHDLVKLTMFVNVRKGQDLAKILYFRKDKTAVIQYHDHGEAITAVESIDDLKPAANGRKRNRESHPLSR